MRCGHHQEIQVQRDDLTGIQLLPSPVRFPPQTNTSRACSARARVPCKNLLCRVTEALLLEAQRFAAHSRVPDLPIEYCNLLHRAFRGQHRATKPSLYCQHEVGGDTGVVSDSLCGIKRYLTRRKTPSSRTSLIDGCLLTRAISGFIYTLDSCLVTIALFSGFQGTKIRAPRHCWRLWQRHTAFSK